MSNNKIQLLKLIGKEKAIPVKEEPKKEVTQKDIEDKTRELCVLLEKYEGGRAQAAAYICFEIIAYGSHSEYEALGILSEVAMEYRDMCIEVAGDEENN